MVLTYIASDKIVDYLLTVSVTILKRVLNIILVTILVFFYMQKNNK
jgi:hypothetical protein